MPNISNKHGENIKRGYHKPKVWIYWKEECQYCTNQELCEYRNEVMKFKEELSLLEKNTKGVYGTLSFKCDYFNLNEELYWKNNPGECCG